MQQQLKRIRKIVLKTNKKDDYYIYVFNEYDFISDKERKEKQKLILPFDVLDINNVTGLKEVKELSEKSGKAVMNHHNWEVVK